MIKYLASVAVVLGASTFAFAGSPRYELKRVNMGPRPDQFVLVRVYEPTARPYALTGESPEQRAVKPPVRHIPSHVKGTHGAF